MNLLTSSALSLFISTTNAFVVTKDVAELTDRVNSSYQQKEQVRSADEEEALVESSNANHHLVVDRTNKADVGVLHGRQNRLHDGGLFGSTSGRRSLQDEEISDGTEEEEDTCPMPDTCEPNLCACVTAGGKAYDCAVELDAVCKGVTDVNNVTWGIEGCVNYPEYYNNLYCPYAACLAAGGTKGSCGCVFYQKSCDLYANDPDYNTTEEIIQHCSATECCGALGEDDHLAKEGCFDGSPTPLPSMMPSGPTVSPRTASPNGEEEAVESPTDGVPTPTPQEDQEGAPTPVDKGANRAQSVLPGVICVGIAAMVSWLLA